MKKKICVLMLAGMFGLSLPSVTVFADNGMCVTNTAEGAEEAEADDVSDVTIADGEKNDFSDSTIVKDASAVYGESAGYAEDDGTTRFSYDVTYGQTEARSMLSMINAFRTGSDAWYWNSDNTTKTQVSGLGNLTYDYSLEQAAMERAAELVLSFSHTRPDGSICFTALESLPESFFAAGENIAAGYPTASSVFEGWQETEDDYDGQGHRRNMLASDFNAVGIAHVVYKGTHYWVQEFGYTPSPNTAATSANDGTGTHFQTIKNEDAVVNTSGISVPSAVILSKAGDKTTAPSVKVNGLTMSDTWMHDLTVTVYPNWSITDSSLARIDGDTITALADGDSFMTGNVFRKKIRVSVSVSSTAAKFTDVRNKKLFFYRPVYWAVENGITSGTTDTQFSPDNECTRGQIVTFLWKKAGSPEPKSAVNPFADVAKTDYYYKAVLWAVENGITSGNTKTTFAPSQACTRGQIMTFLWKMNGAEVENAVSPFTDVSKNNYYYSAVLWGTGHSITSGTSGTTFSPDGKCTRAQAVTFLYNCFVK